MKASFDLFTIWLNVAGKAYDFVSPASKGPDATVILSSESESKIGIKFCIFLF